MYAPRALFSAFALFVALIAAGCGAIDDNGRGTVTLTGQVLNATTGQPLSHAFVREGLTSRLIEADSAGRFSFELDVDSSMDVSLVASKDGYSPATTSVLAIGGRTIEVPTFELSAIGETQQRTSGRPSNVLLLEQTATTIGVKESGSTEVAGITFQVADSVGRPVVLAQGTNVNFSIGSGPGGGEFISPTAARTDNNGKVTVNLSSGTKAGVVQVVAQMNVGGRVVRSQPIAVTIHGGLPDQSHFSLGPATFNFPGLNTLGLTDAISVIVGDKYSNPVRPNTAVYFSSSHGVIGGSTNTDAAGRGAVKLSSGNPLPTNGVVVVTATTVDENRQNVSAKTPVLFSGVPRATVSPSTATLNQVYTLVVEDQNGNPLVAGTTIAVTAEGDNVKVAGSANTTLDETVFADGARDTNGDGLSDAARDGDNLDYEDVRTGFGVTRFQFQPVRASSDPADGEPVLRSITVKVSGPNGKVEFLLPASGNVTITSEGATLERRGNAVVVRLGR